MKILLRYLRVYLFVLRNSIMNMIIYRADFITWTVVHAFELLTNVAFFKIIFLRTSSIGGWDIYQVLVLLGFMEMTLALGSLTFYPMMYNFSEMIRKGDLDWKLVKPINTQFLITFPWIDVSDAASLLTGILMIAYSLSHQNGLNLFINVPVFLVHLFLAMIVMYSLVVLMLTMAFKTTRINYIEYFFWNLQWQGRYPATVFKGVVHFVFMFIVPIGLISTVPAQTLFGAFDWRYSLALVSYAAILFFLARKVFSDNLKGYSSASS